MAPAKKRAKTKTKASTSSKSSSDAAAAMVPSSDDLDTLYDELMYNIQSRDSQRTAEKEYRLALSSSLLTLKGWQQTLLSQLEASQSQLHHAWSEHQKQKRALHALAYEKEHLDKELEICRNFEMKNLKRLAAEEQASSVSASATATKDSMPDIDTDADAETAASPPAASSSTDDENNKHLTEFLKGASVHDPNDKQKIIARLHQELNARGSLERDLKLRQQELETLNQQLQSQNSFLQALPDHLASLERNSLPLQKFMATKQPPPPSDDGDDHRHLARMIGTERQQRLQSAKTLPPPLYTLFVQLQHYLDRPPPTVAADEKDEKSATTSGNTTLSISGTDSNADNKHVVLQLAFADVASSSKSTTTTRLKNVRIHFQYHPQVGRVSAVARGCTATLNQDILLDELFPNDKRAAVRGVAAAAAATTTAHGGTNDSPSSTTLAHSYHWCNYLAGLHTVLESQTTMAAPSASTTMETEPTMGTTTSTSTANKIIMNNSTRVIVQELHRRVRANATLKHILHSLQRKHVPLPPGSSTTSTNNSNMCKLKQFAPVKLQQGRTVTATTTTSDAKLFAVTLSKGDATWQVEVRIHMARYPAVPPIWSLTTNNLAASSSESITNNDGDTATTLPVLYDDRLAALERRVNTVDGLQALVEQQRQQRRQESSNGRNEEIDDNDNEEDKDDDETAYEWILLLQLRHILQSLGSSSDDGQPVAGRYQGGRQFKGRDRDVPITET